MAAETEPRLPLSRERILRAAVEMADTDGVESLTMRRLAGELGFEAMSLYNHVSNKDDLLDGMLDAVLAETKVPSPEGDWAAAVRSSAISVHDALQRHAWACRLLTAPGRIRPARLRYMDRLLGRVREAGFSADATYTAYHVLDAHIFGFALWQTAHSFDAAAVSDLVASLERIIPADEYPHLHEHAQQHLSEGAHHEASAFELGLDLILEGLEQVRTRG